MIKQLAFFLALVASSSAMELTSETFASATDGKTVFLKFFAPWCGHCKAIKPTWDQLIDEFAGDESKLIADVDCDGTGKSLCNDIGIQGFPTLKYGDPSDLQDYEGGRDYEELKAFAEENLKPMCSIKNIDLCDDDKKARIKEFMDMPMETLVSMVATESVKLDDAESKFEEEVEKLQAKFEQLSQEKDDEIASVKASGLGMMKSVIAARESAGEEVKDEL